MGEGDAFDGLFYETLDCGVEFGTEVDGLEDDLVLEGFHVEHGLGRDQSER